MKVKSAAKYEFWQYIHAQSNSFTNLNMNVQSTANFTLQQQIHESESPISNPLPTSHCLERLPCLPPVTSFFLSSKASAFFHFFSYFLGKR